MLGASSLPLWTVYAPGWKPDKAVPTGIIPYDTIRSAAVLQQTKGCGIMIRGVLFDMDGVLFDTEALGEELMPKAAAEYGQKMEKALYHRLIGTNENLLRSNLRQEYGEDFPFDEFHDRFLAYFLDIAKAGQLPRKPGLAKCMQGLKNRGMKLALATSTQRPVVECYLAHTPELAGCFDATICGTEVPNGKPAPDIYRHAAERLGLRPEECVGVEDSRNGLISLRGAGCHSVMIPDLLPYTEELYPYVDTCLASLHQLPGLIDRLNALS